MKDLTYVKIPDDNGDFTIFLKKTVIEEDNGDKELVYFEPGFTIKDDRIVRKDIIYERKFVLGYESNGFALSNEDDFKQYAREKFEAFRGELLINPFAVHFCGKKEPEYTDEEITKTEFSW